MARHLRAPLQSQPVASNETSAKVTREHSRHISTHTLEPRQRLLLARNESGVLNDAIAHLVLGQVPEINAQVVHDRKALDKQAVPSARAEMHCGERREKRVRVGAVGARARAQAARVEGDSLPPRSTGKRALSTPNTLSTILRMPEKMRLKKRIPSLIAVGALSISFFR